MSYRRIHRRDIIYTSYIHTCAKIKTVRRIEKDNEPDEDSDAVDETLGH